MNYLGDFTEDVTVYMMFNTYTSDDPSASSTISNFTSGDIHIHKDDGLTQRNNAAGITVSVDFDGITGSHMVKIDTSDDTVGGFWVTGHDYFVRIEGTTVDGATINSVVGHFSIENRFNEVNVTQWLGTAAATPTIAGVPEVDVTHWLGTAAATPTVAGVPEVDVTHMAGGTQTVADLKDFADEGYDPATNKVQGVVLTDTCTTNTDMVGTDNAALAATALTDATWTDAKAGYIDHAISTIDTNVDTLITRITAAVALASICTEARLAELDAANLPTDIADIPTVAEFNARTIVSADYLIASDTLATVTNLTNAPTNGDLTATMKASVNTEAKDVLTVDTIADSYATDGSLPTIAQAILAIQQMMQEKSITGTTMTVKKPDGSTTAMTFTLDSATTPTEITRAT